MAIEIEIVDLPIDSMVIFQFVMLNYQRVTSVFTRAISYCQSLPIIDSMTFLRFNRELLTFTHERAMTWVIKHMMKVNIGPQSYV